MKKRYIFIIGIALSSVLAAAAETHGADGKYLQITGREHDFWQRVFNFVIFAGILYYLLANPIKNFFKNRSEAISKRLKETELKLQEAKELERVAQARLDEADTKAKEILKDAKKEAKLLAKKIEQKVQDEMEALEKQFEQKADLAQRKSVRSVIEEVLRENLSEEDIALDANKVIEIVSKKVA